MPAGGLVEQLREVKDPDELDAIATAARLADEVYASLLERGLVGRTEREVALALEYGMRDARRRGPGVPVDRRGGAHGALPHAEPRDVRDRRATRWWSSTWARSVDGYCSDCTRTFATGDARPARCSEVYELVRARRRAGARRRPRGGRRAGRSTRSARDIIDAAGHGEHFGHGLGHGVGLEVHEAPRLAQTAEDALAPATS